MKTRCGVCILRPVYVLGFSQSISYTEPEPQDSRSLDFEIIGKIHDNYLIYKNNRSDYAICVYDNSMKLLNRNELRFLPDKILNVDFIVYPDFAYLIYQFQKRNVLYCSAVKINSDGKSMIEPVRLDTTHINFFADTKIYSTVASEDKSKIMIYKIQKKNGKFDFTTLLFDDSLRLQHESKIPSNFDDRKDLFSDFFVDNTGNFVFTRGNRSNTRDFMQDLSMVTKSPDIDTFSINRIDLSGNYLDNVKLKIDNQNKHYVINSLYYLKKRGNVDGIFTGVWDIDNKKMISQNFQHLDDSLRMLSKTNTAADSGSSPRTELRWPAQVARKSRA